MASECWVGGRILVVCQAVSVTVFKMLTVLAVDLKFSGNESAFRRAAGCLSIEIDPFKEGHLKQCQKYIVS